MKEEEKIKGDELQRKTDSECEGFFSFGKWEDLWYMCTHILKLRDREAEREKKVKGKRTAYVQVWIFYKLIIYSTFFS